MNPRVKSVAATEDYRLHLTFTNGEVGTYDCRHLLDFGVFRELKDIAYFLRATVVDGTVAWPNDQDVCPDTLYEDSIRQWPVIAEQSVGHGAADDTDCDG
jgi:hypothetical protein